ncbi:hypothetical protein Q4506_16540 [Colwellia sp. 4_MG-2023]|jgi:hypothetical protein|uniref:hypothetical protein n=1 Tax=unclassified Colwellia TaxID=196834 RepID=UPI001C09EADA|nr:MULTISPECIES: hypothetical protein [unclassified Colwellia]MBU2925516.1 hypothetical protein [Colwellia sp. C2M11]MDO6508638.1 hypothetical protein [Colwellia sp. 5_MG-2023]MDO6557292.1 hypothetical protein [Colwellia sp. 4_MG-2023]MDO6651516.1 hypothetical protein [Colwellia sp. 3_MG-2023]MDO6667059.1 hypothetical protein [Colwellia sp. 2_MG-2023]
MINNINTYSNLFNASSSASTTTSEIDEIIAANKQETITTEQAGESNSNLFLSSRAQKVDSLSREFFNQGGLNFDDIDLFKERAYELGLISKQDYSRLAGTASAASDASEAADNALPNQSLVSYISDFLVRLDEPDSTETDISDEESSDEDSDALTELKQALSTAKTILDDVELAKTDPDFKESLTSTLALLKETIDSDSFDKIPLDDRAGLAEVYKAVDIIDKISPQRLNNDKLNQYIKIGLV